VIIAMLVIGLAGCAQVPLHGPVEPGPEPGAAGVGSVRIEAQSPQPGAEPGQIAQGFLDAMSTYVDGYPLAKEFLTPAAQSQWAQRPIVIYDSLDLPVIDGVVHFKARRVGDIDADGQYTSSGDSAVIDLALEMTDQSGEWRISTPPPGVLITTLDRDNEFSPYVTYYPSPRTTVLVPDLVWLPGTGAALPTVLARALVDGPTARLGESVANAFPEGTVVDGVTLDTGGVATVSLSGPLVDASNAQKQAMAAQLAYTLRQVPVPAPASQQVVGVELSVDGEPLAIPGAAGVSSPSVFPQWDPLLAFRRPAGYALVDDRLVSIDPTDGATAPVGGPLGDSADGAVSVAVNLQETIAATVSANGRSVTSTPVITGAQATLQTFTGIDLATPSWDRFGNLWVVDRIAEFGSALYVVDPTGQGRDAPVQAPALSNVRVLSLRVAPDGVRVAATVELPDETTRLLMLRVVPGAAIALTGVADAADLPGIESVGEMSWVGETEVAVVASAPERPTQPAIVRIDASAVTPEVQNDVIDIAGYSGGSLLALTDDSTIHRRESAITWAVVSPGTAVTYPG